MLEFTDRKQDCCGCHACQSICPVGCIHMVADSEGFLYPSVDDSACTQCGLCESVCPMRGEPPKGNPPSAYAAWNNDQTILEKSSSGGIFFALMKHTFLQNGVVFGAAFDETMTLQHLGANSFPDGFRLMGSKYLQSTIGDAYKSIKRHLIQKRKVLFTGTPCQISGLYAFLGMDDDNLLTCDVVCHGVPSPKVFDLYRKALECRHGAKTRRVSFRKKTAGWKKYSVAFEFENDEEHFRIFNTDPFMSGFLQNTFLRPCCHTCRFCGLPRRADISLGDFWGVGDHHPEWDDDWGTSIVLVQTEKGQSALDTCAGELTIHTAELNSAIASNPCICRPSPQGQYRDAFFRDFDRLPFEAVIKRHMTTPDIWQRLTRRARNILSGVLPG